MSHPRIHRRLAVAAIAALVLGIIQVVPALAASTLYVGPDGGSGECATPTYSDIETAAAASSPGDTIHICTGTYNLGATITVPHDLTFEGDGAITTIIDGSNGGTPVRLFTVTDSITLVGLTLRNGGSVGDGGAIAAPASVAVSSSTLSGNVAGGKGGAIWAGTVSVDKSTFAGNSAGGTGGAIDSEDSTTATNSTFSANGATGSGGAVYGGSSATITNSTFSGNSSGTSGAVLATSATISNSIIADSTGDNCAVTTLTDGGGNFSTDASCAFTEASSSNSVSSGDLALVALADNGGQTETMALGAGSLAINAGIDSVCVADPVGNMDQRGDPRPVGTNCDSGAFEAGLDHIVIGPANTSISADVGSQAYAAEAYDVNGNPLADVTAATAFTIGGDACPDAVCSATVVGDYPVAGTYDTTFTDATTLTITAGALERFAIETIGDQTAGEGFSVTATAKDQYDNTVTSYVGTPTLTNNFSGSGANTPVDGTFPAFILGSGTTDLDPVDYTAETGRTVTVGDAGKSTDSNAFDVTAGVLDHILISPHDGTITFGASQAYTAATYDPYGNLLADVTGSTTFTIDGSPCTGATCTPTLTGDRPVVGTYDTTFTDTTTLHVDAFGALDHFAIETIGDQTAGEGFSVTATAKDQYDNTVTSYVGTPTLTNNFSGSGANTPVDGTFPAFILGSGTTDLDAVDYTAETGRTVTVGDAGKSTDSNAFDVTAGVLASIAISPLNASVSADVGGQAYTATGFDAFANSLGDVTADTTFTIDGDACPAAVCSSTLATGHDIAADDAGKTAATSLTITAGVLASIAISPLNASVSADVGSQAYTATGFDAFANSLGDVTADTTFTIDGDACPAAVCSSTLATGHDIAADDAGKTAATSLTITAGVLASIAISPLNASVSADVGSQAYTATGFDAFANSLGDVTADTTFTIDGDACPAAVCSSTLATGHDIAADDAGKTAATSLTITAGVLASIAISPLNASVSADVGGQAYTATGFDAFANSLGDVTADTTFTIDGDACPAAVCSSTLATGHDIAADDAGKTAATSLTITAGVLASIAISPLNASVSADVGSQAYTATGFDAFANSLGDVTADTTFTIDGDACPAAVCSSTLATGHDIAADDAGKTAATSLTITAGVLASIAISPLNASVSADVGSQAYTATGFDAFANSLGDVTADTTFTIDGDACPAAVCSSTLATGHDIAADDAGKTAATSLTITAGVLASIAISPLNASVSADVGGQAYTATGFDAFANSLGDVTADTTFTIDGDACPAAVCSSTLATGHDIAADDAGKTAATSLTITAGVLASIAISPLNASVSADVGSQAYTATGFDAFANSLGDVTADTTFTIDGDACPAAVCSSTLATGHDIAADDAGKTAATSLTITAGVLASIAISPLNASVSADVGGQAYTATGFDAFANSLGDVTADTTFTIDGDACPAAVCSSTLATGHDIAADDAGKTAATSLTITAGVLASIAISPLNASVSADVGGQAYTATGFDAFANSLGDVTADTTFTIDGDACPAAVCSSTLATGHDIAADDAGKTAATSLTITAGVLASIAISPLNASVSADVGGQAYTATGFDAFANSLGDVTADTTFTIDGDACPAAVCSSTLATGHDIAADDAGKTAATSLTITAGVLASIAISPLNASVSADVGGQAYTATGFDAFANSLGDVTADTTFTIDGDACPAAVCSSTLATGHDIAADDAGKTAATSLTITAGVLASIAISPLNASVSADVGGQAYTATGFDAFANSLGDVTADTTFTIDGDACPAAVCSSTLATGHDIAADDAGKTAATSLTITAGVLASIAISPLNASVSADVGGQAYTATGFDAFANSLGDVTADTTFTIDGDACPAAVCSSTLATGHDIAADDAGKTAATSLTITAGVLASIAISPLNASVSADVGSQAYTATGFDAFANSLGDVTADTTFTIDGDACPAAVCSSTLATGHDIAADDAGKTAATSLTITAGVLASIAISPLNASVSADVGGQAYTATGFDAFANSLGDVTADTTFTIDGDACPAAVCSSTLATGHDIAADDAGKTAATSLTITAGVLASLVVAGPDTAIAGVGQNFEVTAEDAFANTITTYDGTVEMTSSDAEMVPSPLSSTLTNGVGRFLVVLKTVGSQTVSATDGALIAADHTITVSVAVCTYHSLTPARILDTRVGNGLSGPFSAGEPRAFQVTGFGGVPLDAIAVTGNLTVTNATDDGAVYLGPDFTATPSSSTINFKAGDTIANGVTGALAVGGSLSATYMAMAGTTSLIFDVTGYFTPDTTGSTYHSLTPARILDTRVNNGLGGKFSAGIPRTFQVTGRGGVPLLNITAVTGNLTVTDVTNGWAVYLGPDFTAEPTSSTINFGVGDTIANGVTVALADNGTLSATYLSTSGNTASLIFDVTGYFTTDSSGSKYVPLTPLRMLDTRYGNGLSGKFSAGVPRTFQVTGRGDVPLNATAVTGNLTVTGETMGWAVFLGPNPTASPTSSTINFAVGDTIANGVTVALGSGGSLSATYLSMPGQTASLIFDVTGYFTPDTSGATYHPLTPARVLDTRYGNGLSGPFSAGEPRTFQVTGFGGVPATAIAVTGNLTVVAPTTGGAVYLGPDATATPSSSTINFSTGDVRANGVTVALAGDGSLSATYLAVSGTTNLVFDVTGYFTRDMTGATYHSLTPARVLDTRVGNGLSGPFAAKEPRTFQVTGFGGVPDGATAVTGNLTVTNVTTDGALYLGPEFTAEPTSSTINFRAGDTLANGVTVALAGDGSLSATYLVVAGTTSLIFDVTGYFTVDSSGTTYHPLAPARILDTRYGNGLSGPFSAGEPRTFHVTGRGGVPSNALAVTGNVTVTNVDTAGAVYLGPISTATPSSSTINFGAHNTVANGVTVALGSSGTLSATYLAGTGTTAVIFDVSGYFAP